MKRSLLIIAPLWVAIFTNAQITLLQSDIYLVPGSGVEIITTPYSYNNEVQVNHYVIGEYILSNETQQSAQTLYIYDTDFNLVKSFSLAQLGVANMYYVRFISRNIFTNDGTWSWLRGDDNNGQCVIVNENGQILATLQGYTSYSALLKVDNKYLLAIHKGQYGGPFDIYSLPGNGEAQDVSEVAAPQKNARKYLHNDQVLIDSNDKTYTIQGQEVK